MFLDDQSGLDSGLLQYRQIPAQLADGALVVASSHNVTVSSLLI